MAKLHFLWLCWGPIFFAFSLAWLVKHPDDWSGPAIVAPLSFVYGVVTYVYAFRLLKRRREGLYALIAAMVASPLVGLGLALRIIFGD